MTTPLLSRPPAAVSPAERASILATPLGTLRFPARMESFFARKSLATVKDLVEWSPAALLLEPNLGKKSVADARTLLRERFGMSWESLQELACGATTLPPPRISLAPEAAWQTIGASLSPPVADLDLGATELPSRLVSHARRLGLRTVGELVAVPYAEIAEARNVGGLTIRQALDELVRLRGPSAAPPPVVLVSAPPSAPSPLPAEEDPLPPGTSWRGLLQASFRTLAASERLVVTQRSGLAGPALTLLEAGECLGVSRERARQLEAQAIDRVRAARWWFAARARLEAACPGPLRRLHDVSDELFTAVDDDAEAFAFFVNDVLEAAVRVVLLEDGALLARLPRREIDALLADIRHAARGLVFPFPRGNEAARLAAASPHDPAAVEALAPLLAEEWIEEDGVVRGFGTTKRSAVLAWVRAEGRPVRRAELDEKFGRHQLPADLVHVDWGIVALPEQIPDWDRWAARMPGLVRSVIEELGPERQWSTRELIGPIAERAEVPEWLNEWTLGSLVRASDEVRYLGRNVVALPEAGEDRLQVHALAEQLLERAGGPLPEDELVTALTASRGIGKHTWALARLRRPFLLFEDRRIGLLPRDRGSSAEAVEAFAADVFATLDAAQRGLGAAAAQAIAAKHGPWDRRLARSLLRHDGRFRLAPGGGVGLAEWEDTRAPTQADVLKDLLVEHDGKVPLAVAIEALPTASGEPLTRLRVGGLANTIHARIEGPVITWMAEPERDLAGADRTQRVIARIPELAAARFCEALDDVKSAEELRELLEGWTRAMRAASQDADGVVDRAQVERLAGAGAALVARYEASSDAEERILCSAAVDYLAAVDDGVTDLVVGGLDDDEHVLSVVAEELSPRSTG